MMWGYGTGMGGWPGALMAIGMIVFWAAVIAGLVVLVRMAGRQGGGPPPAAVPGPEATLADRFARGEIDAEEYRTRMATLRGVRTSG